MIDPAAVRIAKVTIKKENTLMILRENRNVTKLDNENNNKPETTDVTKSESITNSVEAIKDEH